MVEDVDVLVGHNLAFDVKFLNASYALIPRIPLPRALRALTPLNRVVVPKHHEELSSDAVLPFCTMREGRRFWPKATSHRLNELVSLCGSGV